ncbi:MAG: LpqB family beta-propeller domain-containing protein [Ornithinimicrobium sp.]
MNRSRRRTWWTALLAFVMLTAVAGCGGLPTDDSPRAGQPVLSQPRQVIQVRPEGPSAGATPEQIVRGFLLANISFADGHEVARAYLTDPLAASWVPTDNVVVHTGEPELSASSEGVVRAEVPVQGLLNEAGELSELASSTVRAEDFTLTRVDDQWRINEFPEDFGLWLSVTAFEAQYRTASVNYLSTVEDAFVPDVRWFSRDDGLPTALARALLAPVPEYLNGVVTTGTAEGTTLVAGAVPLDPSTGTATVNLQGPGLTEDPEQVRDIYASFGATLFQAAGVRAVEIQANDQPLTAVGVSGLLSSVEDLGFALSRGGPEYAVLRVDESLTAVDPDDFALRNVPADLQEELALPEVDAGWVDLAMNVESTEFSAVDVDREVLWRLSNDTEIERSNIGENLTRPAFDAFGSLWVAGGSSVGPQVWTIDTRGGVNALAKPLDADWLDTGMSIEAITIAPDGHRAAVLIAEGGEQRLGLVGVVRDQEDRPTALTTPQPAAPTLTAITDVTWASQESLAVLGQRAEDEQDTPYLLPLGEWLRPLEVEAGATDLVGVPTGEGFDLFLITDAGRIYTPEGATWTPYRNGDELIVPAGSAT